METENNDTPDSTNTLGCLRPNRSLPHKANSPMTVMYVEVNNTNFRNSSCYTLATPERPPLIDISIIFAANVNFNTTTRKAYLHFNENVTRLLDNVEQYVRPVQAVGTKVLLSILGNHEGAGICNFETRETARDFARELADAVEQYGLDGIDFDDEWARYGENGTGQPNAWSFVYLLAELRSMIPDKIISFYYYGPAASRLSYQDMIAGTFLDYSWNAIYGTYSPPNVPGLDRGSLGPAAVDVTVTSVGTARTLAQRTVSDGYGIYLCYNLPNNNIQTYLQEISQALYGTDTNVTLNCLQTWPPAPTDE